MELNKTEYEFVTLLQSGKLTAKEICERLKISASYIYPLVSNIRKKGCQIKNIGNATYEIGPNVPIYTLKHGKSSHASSSPVKWEVDEIDKLVETMVDLRLKDPVKPFKDLFYQAQEVALHPDRHRKVSTYKAISNVIRIFRDKYREARNPGEIEVEVPLVIEKDPDYTDPAILSGVSAGLLLNVLLERAGAFLELTFKQPETPAERAFKLAGLEQKQLRPVRKRIPRIALLGVTEPEFQRIKERVNGQVVELMHVKDRRNGRDLPKSASCAIVCCRSSHSARFETTNAYGKQKVHMIKAGGVGAVVDKIKSLMGGNV